MCVCVCVHIPTHSTDTSGYMSKCITYGVVLFIRVKRFLQKALRYNLLLTPIQGCSASKIILSQLNG